ncbi:ECF subfamily RNA polymerase sigma-24 factor [Pseudomonas putida S11]|nr:ECF subfamily RNA polymerase sigma-24 factor [Pseudomonas putida S11]
MIDAAPPPEHSLPALYREHRGWLETWLRRRMGNAWDAADLSQDTFLRILASAQPLADIREPRAYLLTVGKRLLSNFHQRRSLEPSLPRCTGAVARAACALARAALGTCWKPCKPSTSCSTASRRRYARPFSGASWRAWAMPRSASAWAFASARSNATWRRPTKHCLLAEL